MSKKQCSISEDREPEARAPALLTPQQAAAVTLRGASIGLSAGAGSGKTHVLTQRFLSHLDPVGPDAANLAQLDTLVAITFTEAAAREMRNRVRAACFERLVQSPPEHQTHWYQLLRSLDSARISTIHSFCGSLLRRYSVEAGVDPHFSVLDENQADVLRSQIVDDLLRGMLIEGDETLLDLAHLWRIDGLRSRLLELMVDANAGGPTRWETASTDDLLDAWESQYESAPFRQLVADQIVESAAASNLLRILSVAEVNHKTFLERRDILLDQLAKLSQSIDIGSGLRTLREAAIVKGTGGKSAWADPELYPEYSAACTKLRGLIDRLQVVPWDREAARPTAETARRLYQLALEAANRYWTEKASLSRLDFDDLIVRSVALLSDPNQATIREQLANGAHAILVDEFQDTDPQQAALVRALCGERWQDGRLFVVGDIKQSIYRFRGARPEVFRKLREELPDRGKLSLTRCFRSQPAILDFVNSLFVGVWGTDFEPLEPTCPQTTPEPAIEFLWTINPSGQPKAKGDAALARKAEARLIAARLKDLLDSGLPCIPAANDQETDAPPSLQPLRPGHIAVLFRALSDVAYYEAAFKEAELDYYLVGGHAFYAQQEVFDLVNLLRAVASTADDASLAGALRSPFFSLADESLFWLVKQHGSLNLGLMAEKRPAALPRRERNKIDHAATTIAALRGLKDHVSIAELIEVALAETGYDATLLADFMGERKLANLRKLQRLARAADRDGVLDLHGFITELSEFVARMPKEAPASTSSETADVIRLMTVHQAKGLEFPLVVVADIDRRDHSATHNVAFSAALGPLVRPETKAGERKSITGFEMMRAEESQEDRQEAARLFYVACTRAAHYLILSANIDHLETPRGEWCRLLNQRFDLHDASSRIAVPPGYRVPKVRVTERTAESLSAGTRQRRGTDLGTALDRASELASDAPPIPHEVAPFPADGSARKRFSFSQLTGTLAPVTDEGEENERAEEATRPDPASEPHRLLESQASEFDPRSLGSLVHAMLEVVEPDEADSVLDLSCRLAPQYFEIAGTAALHPAVAVASAMVERFVPSPRAKAIEDAVHAYRELEFQVAWPSGRPGTSGRYLHGFIDCLYQTQDGRWVLVDYKTNQIGKAGTSRAAQSYEMQLFVYATAVQAAIGVWPAENILHFLRTGDEHRFIWDASSRKALVSQVNLAIKRVVERKNEVG